MNCTEQAAALLVQQLLDDEISIPDASAQIWDHGTPGLCSEVFYGLLMREMNRASGRPREKLFKLIGALQVRETDELRR